MLYRIKSPHKDMKLLKIKGKGKRQRHKGKFITIPCQFKKKEFTGGLQMLLLSILKSKRPMRWKPLFNYFVDKT